MPLRSWVSATCSRLNACTSRSGAFVASLSFTEPQPAGDHWVHDACVPLLHGTVAYSSRAARYHAATTLLGYGCAARDGGAVLASPRATTARSCAGFKVLRTATLADTKRLYVALTSHLTRLYESLPPARVARAAPLPTFAAWAQRCEHNKRVTLRDIWARAMCTVPGAPQWRALAQPPRRPPRRPPAKLR